MRSALAHIEKHAFEVRTSKIKGYGAAHHSVTAAESASSRDVNAAIAVGSRDAAKSRRQVAPVPERVLGADANVQNVAT